MKRRAYIGWLLITAGAIAQPGRAQQPAHSLHHPIPGDLPVETATDEHTVTPPSSRDELRSAVGPNSPWRDHQPIDPGISRPRASWESPVRELDRDTQSPPGARLSYTEVFTPSVTPFKRLQAYDAVDENGRLTVRDPGLQELTVGENVAVPWSREPTARFVGELNIELSPSWPTPIPGIAGEERVVSYSSSSGHPIAFARDSAGNLFARGTLAETVRLTYVLEAPQFAFQANDVPPVGLDVAIAGIPASERATAPAWLRTSALATLQAAHVNVNERLDLVMTRLVEYFRSFSDAELPANLSGTTLYSDLALGRVGACRHRAYALVLTLQAMGIPARYVGNEAHAWAEVWVFRSGWSRIDLGGWDIPLDAAAATERPQFHPNNVDPFPRPARYESQYSAEAARSGEIGDGTRVEHESPDAGARRTGGSSSGSAGSGASPADGQSSSTGTSGRGGSSGNSASATGRSSGSRGASAEQNQAEPMPDPSGSTDDNHEEAGRSVLSLGPIRSDEQAGYSSNGGFVRGSMLHLDGEVHDEHGAGIGGLPIEIQLLRDHRVNQSLGTTVSQPDGRWDVRVLLPSALETGEYTLRASTAGDSRHLAAIAE